MTSQKDDANPTLVPTLFQTGVGVGQDPSVSKSIDRVGGGGTILTIYMLTSFGFFFINLRNSSKPIGRALEVLNLNRLSLKPSTNSSGTTLNIIFSVTYYLELHNAISIYCASHILPTDVKLVVWTLQNIADLGQLTN